MNMSNSPMNSLLQLFGAVNGQQPVQVQPGVVDRIAQVAGAYASGQTGGMAGKGGGGGGGKMPTYNFGAGSSGPF
jgi:hypothetical protein